MPTIKYTKHLTAPIAHFLKEVRNPEVGRADPYFDLIPVSYLHFLYNDWMKFRGVYHATDFPRNLFSHLLGKITPSVDGMPPVDVIPVMRTGMRVAVFPLAQNPRLLEPTMQILASDGESCLGIESGAYIYPNFDLIPTEIRVSVWNLQDYLKRKREIREKTGKSDPFLNIAGSGPRYS